MEQMFENCIRFEGKGLETWDVSRVENISRMFNNCEIFDGKSLVLWNLDKVIDMKSVFYRCPSLNFDVSNWKNDNLTVKNMESMFGFCSIFKGKGLEKWNVSSVENMSGMFYKCLKLNINFSNWDVSKVKTMESMFFDCKVFEGKGLEKWNLWNVEKLESIFYGCKKFNPDLSNWGNKLRKVNSALYMFHNCNIFQGKGLENWDISELTDMESMFENCINFNANLQNWGYKFNKNLSNMRYMFSNCVNFEGNGLENWQVQNVKKMTSMFKNCLALNVNLSNWEINADYIYLESLNLPASFPKNKYPQFSYLDESND